MKSPRFKINLANSKLKSKKRSREKLTRYEIFLVCVVIFSVVSFGYSTYNTFIVPKTSKKTLSLVIHNNLTNTSNNKEDRLMLQNLTNNLHKLQIISNQLKEILINLEPVTEQLPSNIETHLASFNPTNVEELIAIYKEMVVEIEDRADGIRAMCFELIKDIEALGKKGE